MDGLSVCLKGNPVGIRNSARYCEPPCVEKYLTPLSVGREGCFSGVSQETCRNCTDNKFFRGQKNDYELF